MTANDEFPPLAVFIGDTELGPDTALVIAGFHNEDEITEFIARMIEAGLLKADTPKKPDLKLV